MSWTSSLVENAMSYQRTYTWPPSTHSLDPSVIDEPLPDMELQEWEYFVSVSADNEQEDFEYRHNTFEPAVEMAEEMAEVQSRDDGVPPISATAASKLRRFRKSLARRWARFSSVRVSQSNLDWTLTADKPQEETVWPTIVYKPLPRPTLEEAKLSFRENRRERTGRCLRNSFQDLIFTLNPVIESSVE
jgi:hypothetical protein